MRRGARLIMLPAAETVGFVGRGARPVGSFCYSGLVRSLAPFVMGLPRAAFSCPAAGSRTLERRSRRSLSAVGLPRDPRTLPTRARNHSFGSMGRSRWLPLLALAGPSREGRPYGNHGAPCSSQLMSPSNLQQTPRRKRRT